MGLKAPYFPKDICKWIKVSTVATIQTRIFMVTPNQNFMITQHARNRHGLYKDALIQVKWAHRLNQRWQDQTGETI